MAYWIVTDTEQSKEFIVGASREAQALAAVVKPRYSVIKAEEKDLIRLSAKGVPVIETEAVSTNGTAEKK